MSTTWTAAADDALRAAAAAHGCNWGAMARAVLMGGLMAGGGPYAALRAHVDDDAWGSKALRKR
jgi:hypothetical protein